MTELTTFQYNLIGDVFTRPRFYASSASSRLLECLSYVGKILTDDESQQKIEKLCKGLMNADGEVKKVMFVEENLTRFEELLAKTREHRNISK